MPADAGIVRQACVLPEDRCCFGRGPIPGRHFFSPGVFRTVLLCGLIICGAPRLTAAMPPGALVALKQAGFSDQVIQAVVREKVIETAAFTVQELIDLKKAGMKDETLEVLVTERSFLRQAQPIVYGRSVKPLNLSSVQDLVALQQSGMSDDVIKAVIIAASKRHGDDYDHAWDMLKGMGLEVKHRP